MAQPSSQTQPSRPSPMEQRYKLSPEVADILVPTFKVGVGAGALGVFAGAAAGIIRSAPVALFSVATGIQWFALSSTYYASRRGIILAWGGDERLGRSDRTKASAIAGGCAGFIGGLLRGRRNIVPGVVVMSILGAGGQALINATAGAQEPSAPKKSWLESRWVPITPLTDQQYAEFLEEKILKVDAEIAIIDENIDALRKSAEGQANAMKTPGKDREK